MSTMKQCSEQLLADPLERVDDVAAQWNCHPNFIRKLAKQGKIKIIKLSPHCQRIRRSERLRYEQEVAA